METEPKKMGKGRLLLTLFWSNFYISAFTFGGGFVIVTFMKRKYVDELHWLNENEMLDLTALAQSAPGAIAVNTSILVGWRMGGFVGMLVAVLGTILPPMIILSVISFFYAAFATNRYVGYLLKGMQAGVAAVIFDVVFQLGGKVVEGRNKQNIIMMVLAFCATFFFKINVVYIILAAALIGVVKVLAARRKGAKQ